MFCCPSNGCIARVVCRVAGRISYALLGTRYDESGSRLLQNQWLENCNTTYDTVEVDVDNFLECRG